MPQMQNVLLRSDVDGTTDHTFLPLTDNPTPRWRTNVSGLPEAGQKRIEQQSEKQKNGKTKVNWKIVNPIMEIVPAGTVNSAGVQAAAMVADEEFISITALLSPRGSDATRAELTRMAAQLIAGASYSTGGNINPGSAAAHAMRDVAPQQIAPYTLVNLLQPGS